MKSDTKEALLRHIRANQLTVHDQDYLQYLVNLVNQADYVQYKYLVKQESPTDLPNG